MLLLARDTLILRRQCNVLRKILFNCPFSFSLLPFQFAKSTCAFAIFFGERSVEIYRTVMLRFKYEKSPVEKEEEVWVGRTDFPSSSPAEKRKPPGKNWGPDKLGHLRRGCFFGRERERESLFWPSGGGVQPCINHIWGGGFKEKRRMRGDWAVFPITHTALARTRVLNTGGEEEYSERDGEGAKTCLEQGVICGDPLYEYLFLPKKVLAFGNLSRLVCKNIEWPRKKNRPSAAHNIAVACGGSELRSSDTLQKPNGGSGRESVYCFFHRHHHRPFLHLSERRTNKHSSHTRSSPPTTLEEKLCLPFFRNRPGTTTTRPTMELFCLCCISPQSFFCISFFWS